MEEGSGPRPGSLKKSKKRGVGMNAWEAKQLETRFVSWPWVGKDQLVTMQHWYWNFFDWLCAQRGLTADQLHLEISEKFPVEKVPDISKSIFVYLELRAERRTAKLKGLVNDNSFIRSAHVNRPIAPAELAARRCRCPIRHAFPVIKASPFQPIARPRQLFAEPEIRDRM